MWVWSFHNIDDCVLHVELVGPVLLASLVFLLTAEEDTWPQTVGNRKPQGVVQWHAGRRMASDK